MQFSTNITYSRHFHSSAWQEVPFSVLLSADIPAASGSMQVPTGGTPHPDSRTPASPVPARWSRPARCAQKP